MILLRILLNWRFWFTDPGQGLRFCIPNKLQVMQMLLVCGPHTDCKAAAVHSDTSQQLCAGPHHCHRLLLPQCFLQRPPSKTAYWIWRRYGVMVARIRGKINVLQCILYLVPKETTNQSFTLVQVHEPDSAQLVGRHPPSHSKAIDYLEEWAFFSLV